MNPLQVACAADSRYLPHTATMLRSLLGSQGPAPVEVHFLHGPKLGSRGLDRLKRMFDATPGTLVTHQIDPVAIAGLPAWGRIPTTMWYRILLPELLPDVDRVLYLDVDTLIVDSLAELWRLDLRPYYVGAVTNVPEEHRLGHAGELGLSGPAAYFNSGVLLMNLELMRRDGCSAALTQCARDRLDDLLWPDQDALNLVLGARRLALHPRWNLMNSIRKFSWARDLLDPAEIEEAIRTPAIVHFEGPEENKPWHLLSDHPFRGTYLTQRRQTPWPHFIPDGISARNLVEVARRKIAAGRA